MNPLVGTCVPSSNTTIPIVSDAVHFSRPACRAFCGGTASPAASRTLCSPVLPRWILLGLLSAVQGRTSASSSEFDYQSVRHCSKTHGRATRSPRRFDYQSVRHCSKTTPIACMFSVPFDYQSVRHCSKTSQGTGCRRGSLTTSRFATAPKPRRGQIRRRLV